jgi:predicted transcriptional regulator
MRSRDGSDNDTPFSALGPLEARVMEVIWARGKASVREVADALGRETELAYTTVMTVMSRLAEKRLLTRSTAGRAYIYTPGVSRETYETLRARAEVHGLLEQFGEIAVAQFAEELQNVDPERARRLGEMLRRGPNR